MFYLSKNMNYPKMDEGKNQKMPSMTSRRASKQSIQMVDQPPTSVGVEPMGRTRGGKPPQRGHSKAFTCHLQRTCTIIRKMKIQSSKV